MEEIKLFEFEGQEVRTVVKDEDVWFVGNEVAKILGYSNYRNWNNKFDNAVCFKCN